MSMREQMKVIVEEIRDERDKEILEMIDNEIEITSVILNNKNSIDPYWQGRITQARIIRDNILLGKDEI